MPRIIESSKDLTESPEWVEAAEKLEQQVTAAEIGQIHSVFEMDKLGVVKVVNSYRHALHYMRENRLNMNFRQVHL